MSLENEVDLESRLMSKQVYCCRSCGQEVSKYPSQIKGNVYCGVECSRKHTLIQKGQRISVESEFKRGERPHNFKGSRLQFSRKESKGYVMVYMPEHLQATKAGYVREHRLVMEEHLGRLLLEDEIVHHKDGNTRNNVVDNLEVMKKVEHDRMNVNLNIHKRWNDRKGGGVNAHEDNL